MRVFFAAAVIAVCCAFFLGGAAAVDDVTLPAGTVLYHATKVSHFSTKFHSRFVSDLPSDDKHPFSPSWFAPVVNPASAIAPVLLRDEVGPDGQAARTTHLYSYETLQPLHLLEFLDGDAALAYGKSILDTPGVKYELETVISPGLTVTHEFDQLANAHLFCEHMKGTGGRYHGFVIVRSPVREEMEYVLCKAHDPTFLKMTERHDCTMRATKSWAKRTKGLPVLWVWCGESVNQDKWFKWDLNVAKDDPAVTALTTRGIDEGVAIETVRLRKFKVGKAVTDRPWLYLKLVRFRELLVGAISKKKAAKGAVQPDTGTTAGGADDDEIKKHLKPPTKAEVALLKIAATQLEKTAKVLKLKPEVGL